MSPYSTFFNSGLHRRSSLPSQSSSSRKSTTAYYLNLQRRDEHEHRSFLSLDLAESRLSERHLPQVAISCLIPPVPALPPLPVVSPLHSTTMPPDLPPPPYSIHHTHKRSPPTLPEIPLLPALHCPLPPKSRPQRPLPDPPSTLTDDPRSSVLTKPKHLRSNLAIITDPHRLSNASVSTASTRVRRRNRWDALDALEGRRKPSIDSSPPFIPPVPKRKPLNFENIFVNPSTFANPIHSKPALPNFMSMSDDSDSDHSSPEDFLLPPSAVLNTLSYLDVDDEEEEGVVLEATRCPAPSSPPPPTIQRTWLKPTTSTKLPASTSSKHLRIPRPRKPSARNNHSHYKSFIELDMDDLVEPSNRMHL